MRMRVSLDDGLLGEAERLLGTSDRSAVLREALSALIEREAARRLARLGGSIPNARVPRRRRTA